MVRYGCLTSVQFLALMSWQKMQIQRQQIGKNLFLWHPEFEYNLDQNAAGSVLQKVFELYCISILLQNYFVNKNTALFFQTNN